MFARVLLALKQLWFRLWHGTEHGTSHDLNQWLFSLLTHKCIIRPRWLLHPRSKLGSNTWNNLLITGIWSAASARRYVLMFPPYKNKTHACTIQPRWVLLYHRPQWRNISRDLVCHGVPYLINRILTISCISREARKKEQTTCWWQSFASC